MLGRLHLWMSRHGFEVKGGGRLPDGRVHDRLLTSLASGGSRESEEELIAIGAWRADMWRLSDIYCGWMARRLGSGCGPLMVL